MNDDATRYEAREYLDTNFVPKGLGGWRSLYLQFIAELRPGTVLDVGAGTPDFLAHVSAARRIAVDVGERYAPSFERLGIEFHVRDLDRDGLHSITGVDAAICSDVFEHLINPAAALDAIVETLRSDGVLFSHVPNEFRVGHVLRVALGLKEAVLFHQGRREWEDPHFRRFTDRGFRSFLARRFTFNLALTDMRARAVARILRRLGAPLPYGLQGGPTYASTNDSDVYGRLVVIRDRLAHVG